MSRLAWVLALWALPGCDDDPGPAAEIADAGVNTPCGLGPTRLELGTGHPFQPVPDLRFAIEAGRQGGFHVDVSLRMRGALDPDHADLDLALWHGDWQVSRHLSRDALLLIDPDSASCGYENARLFLLDREGGMLGAEALPELAAGPLRLDVAIDTPGGAVAASREIRLEPPPPP